MLNPRLARYSSLMTNSVCLIILFLSGVVGTRPPSQCFAVLDRKSVAYSFLEKPIAALSAGIAPHNPKDWSIVLMRIYTVGRFVLAGWTVTPLTSELPEGSWFTAGQLRL